MNDAPKDIMFVRAAVQLIRSGAAKAPESIESSAEMALRTTMCHLTQYHRMQCKLLLTIFLLVHRLARCAALNFVQGVLDCH